MISINISSQKMDKVIRLMTKAPKEVQKAAAVSINRTILTARKEASVNIRKNYIIKAKDIKTALSYTRAKGNGFLMGEIKAKGPAPLLTAFRVSIYKRTKRGYTRPPKVQVLKSSGAKTVNGMFHGKSKSSGYIGLMQRTSKKRYPLRIPHVPSVAQMLGSERVLNVITAKAEETLNKRFLHEVEYRINKLGV